MKTVPAGSPALARSAVAENNLVVGLDLFDDDGRSHFVDLDRFRINDHHPLHRGEPEPPVPRLPARRLAFAVGLARLHAVRRAEGGAFDDHRATIRHGVQLFPLHAINPAQPAQPQKAEVIFEHPVDRILLKTGLACEGKESPLPVTSQAVLRADPKRALGILMDGPDTVVAQTIAFGEGLKLALLEAGESLTLLSKPYRPVPIFQHAPHVPNRLARAPGIARDHPSIPPCGHAISRPDPKLPRPILIERRDAAARQLPMGNPFHEAVVEFEQTETRLGDPHATATGRPDTSIRQFRAWLRDFNGKDTIILNPAESAFGSQPDDPVGSLAHRPDVIIRQPVALGERPHPARLQLDQPLIRAEPDMAFAIFAQTDHRRRRQALTQINRRPMRAIPVLQSARLRIRPQAARAILVQEIHKARTQFLRAHRRPRASLALMDASPGSHPDLAWHPARPPGRQSAQARRLREKVRA